jgi:hypothetical protein
MKWILIIAFQSAGSYPFGFTMQEFGTKSACENAQNWVLLNKVSPSNILRTTCIEKG